MEALPNHPSRQLNEAVIGCAYQLSFYTDKRSGFTVGLMADMLSAIGKEYTHAYVGRGITALITSGHLRKVGERISGRAGDSHHVRAITETGIDYVLHDDENQT